MRKAVIETYGCTLNHADSDMIEGILKNSGIDAVQSVYNGQEADYVIVNTCTVKKPTEQRILDRLEKLSKEGRKLIVTGCMASANADRIRKAAPDASIITINNMPEIAQMIESGAVPAERASYKRIDRAELAYSPKGPIARIPISDGCLSSCTFCETKFARGPLNSFSEQLITRAVSNAVANGAREIELASQDTGAYGIDRKTDIAELVSKAILIDGDFRIRIGMLNPEHLHRYIDRLIDCYKSEKVYKFIHLPLQSGSDSVLKSMKRNYSPDEFIGYVKELHSKIRGISIWTDMIVGYPTETESDFMQSMDIIEEIKPAVTNVSKFWERPNAPARKIGKIRDIEIKKRSIKMSRAAKAIQYKELRKEVSKTEKIIITEKHNQSNIGRDDYYRNVVLNEPAELGTVVEVRITGNSSVCLIASKV